MTNNNAAPRPNDESIAYIAVCNDVNLHSELLETAKALVDFSNQLSLWVHTHESRIIFKDGIGSEFKTMRYELAKYAESAKQSIAKASIK